MNFAREEAADRLVVSICFQCQRWPGVQLQLPGIGLASDENDTLAGTRAEPNFRHQGRPAQDA